ncbi:unnamed protein product [Larinioides sclopetarius]|uniref:Uncharacterized protein n=1 Tax=Larinioides sclopetarius TaxID=280406 RepID=A0AAV1Z7I6_9ARAC
MDLVIGGLQARKPIPVNNCRVWDLLHAKVVVKRLPVGGLRSLERSLQAQVPSSSTDHSQSPEFRPFT